MKKVFLFSLIWFCLILSFKSFVLAQNSSIIITEVLPNPEGKDASGEFIELFNQGETKIDLTGWQINDNIGQSRVFTFQAGQFLDPQKFSLLYIGTTKINLNNEGDGLKLFNQQGDLVDEVVFSETKEGLSYSRNQDVWFWVNPTPGKPNLFPKINLEEENAPKESEKGAITKKGSEGRVLGSNLALFSLAILIALGSGIAVFFLKRS